MPTESEPDLTPEDPPKAVGELNGDRPDRASDAQGGLKAPVADDCEALTTGREPRRGVDIFTSDNHLRPIAEIEADVIRLAIGHYHGQMSEVARRLGIGRSTLYRKLSELDIDTPGR